ncbi:MAG: phosphoribosylformylglycinamidine synthase I [Pelagibacteraceae bacterium]|nr:phosphoribosylformylglycinamidine synthase I [Pelagibacteraceae bacterium]|tara:strand:+ start:146 stop:829 length:684 start_codon:yes stop_codon:yes gene_type:complete
MSLSSAVITFPGSNCDRDAQTYLEILTNQDTHKIWHKDVLLPKVDLLIIPGGFSFGDYLRSGAMAAKSPIIDDVLKHAERGGYIIGICNGFQILTEIGLLDGALNRNVKLKFLAKNCFIKKNHENNFNKKISQDQCLSIPVAHNEGSYYNSEEGLKLLQDNEQISFLYCDEEGNTTDSSNLNGSLNHIAGITNKKKNVLGLMPHPERAFQDFHTSQDGQLILESLLG